MNHIPVLSIIVAVLATLLLVSSYVFELGKVRLGMYSVRAHAWMIFISVAFAIASLLYFPSVNIFDMEVTHEESKTIITVR